MGDRANVFFPDEGSLVQDLKGVFLYTHWTGSELPVTVQTVLKKQKNWDDQPYLARVIFNAMTKDDQEGTSGYGISSHLGDNEHPIVVVDCENERVGFLPEEANSKVSWIAFAKFIEMDEKAILARYSRER